MNDPSLDPATQQEFQNRERQRQQAVNKLKQEKEEQQNASRITSMIKTLGQLDLDERGGWDFRGTSSGAVFLGRMKEHFGGLLGKDPLAKTFLPRPSRTTSLLSLDLPGPAMGSSPGEASLSSVFDLPPKERARQLSSCALTCATALLRIVHVPSFFENFEEIYGKSAEDYNADDKRFLGLLYSVLAVGAMYNIAEEDVDNQVNYTEAVNEG